MIQKSARLFHRVPAKFNQLLVFDPAISHGVKQVRGIRDPKEARLVLHGWFVQPRVFWKGPLRVYVQHNQWDQLEKGIREIFMERYAAGRADRDA